jgi:hypothetical protein
MRLRALLFVLLAGLVGSGCSGGGSTGGIGPGDSGPDTDTDSDTDSDSDSDSDTDNDGGIDCEEDIECDDDNLCTDDICDPVDGCIYDNNEEPCDDLNACTIDDACVAGLCQGGEPLLCNDDNVCTDDTCDTETGCVFTNNSADCDDGQFCSIDDQCVDGVCTGQGSYDCDDSNPCTTDGCDDDFGCQYSNNTADCDDNDVCTVGDVCSNGDCTPGPTPLDCNDSDVCTDDSCHPVDGCQYDFNSDPCDDSDACTMSDECYAGDCIGLPLDADDDSFVSDACGGQDCDDDDEFVNPLVFEGPIGDPVCSDTVDNDCDNLTDGDDPQCDVCIDASDCDDGDVCNGLEDCDAGSCVPGTALICDDSNVCTTDGCDMVDGCEYTDNALPCDDNDECTLGDYCSAGACTEYTSDLVCNDSNVCTNDSCDTALGCQYVNNTQPCTDGDDCTIGDQCQGGSCVSGPLLDADDDGYADGTGGCPGNDCDDSNPDIHPGAEELCDGLDNDCNWLIDEGCPECNTVVAADEIKIDSDWPYSGYQLANGDEVFNIFIVEAEAYNILEIQVGFWDFCPGDPLCSGGSGNGLYSAHIYADDDGLPGAELAASATVTAADQWTDLFTFTLPTPLALVQDQIFWVGIRSEEDQTTNLYLPLVDGGVLIPYYGAALYSVTDDEYYGVIGNFVIRVEGCAEGPWLRLIDHDETPSVVVAAGNSVDTNGTLENRGVDDTAVSATLYVEDDDLTVTQDTADYGTISAGGSASGSPDFTVDTSDTAFGIYPVFLDSSDGPNSWLDAWGIYVQGTGCTDENYQLLTDNNANLAYYNFLEPGDRFGQYFVVDATAFTATTIDVDFFDNEPWNAQFRLRVYTYLSGFPDKLIYESGWQTVNGSGQTTETWALPTPLTFSAGDTFWVVIESQDDLTGSSFGPIVDDGDSQTGSWFNGVLYDDSASSWSPIYWSHLIRVNGCRSTELLYDSHTSSPDPIPLDASSTLDITIRNVGAEDASDPARRLVDPRHHDP